MRLAPSGWEWLGVSKIVMLLIETNVNIFNNYHEPETFCVL